ncbi:MAG: sensor histidine kinase [Vicinamibacterales bacterium]
MQGSHAIGDRPMPTDVPVERLERVLAVSRAFLTVTALVAIFVDPTEPAQLRELTYGVLLGYAAYSLVVWVLVHRATRITPRHTYALHGLDVLWTSALTFVSQGPVSPFFMFFLFLVLASAYRWGFRATLGTALGTIAVYLVESAIAVAGPWQGTVFETMGFDLNSIILRIGYLLMTGGLLGYLAEQEKSTRAELAAIAATARQPPVNLGLGGFMATFGRGLAATFAVPAVAIVVKDGATGRTLLWRIDGRGEDARVRREELDADLARQWLFEDGGLGWYALRPADAAAGAVVHRAEPGAWRLVRDEWPLPRVLLADPHWDAVTAVNMTFDGEWRARAYLFGPPERRLERRVHFLRALAEHTAPALTNVFLTRRLRARAGAAERARVARELHDGAIQSLFAIDMKLEAMRRDPGDAAGQRGELAEVQRLVRREVQALRDLMQALRPLELESSEQLPDVLATVVERFHRESGIGARFVATGGSIAIPPPKALELVRIAQEALMNVRKHSGAGQVLVRLAAAPRSCQLVVEDDGRGFAFEGRLSAEELDDRHCGPSVIKERARLIGAALAVESSPGSGARVEVTVPGGAHA